MITLVGYQKGTSKKTGKSYCIAHVVQDKANGVTGAKTDNIFMPDDLVDLFTPGDVGKELILDYNVSGGRAFLVNATVKK